MQVLATQAELRKLYFAKMWTNNGILQKLKTFAFVPISILKLLCYDNVDCIPVLVSQFYDIGLFCAICIEYSYNW